MEKIEFVKPFIEVIEVSDEEIVATSGVSVTAGLFGPGNGGVNVG